MRVIFTSVAVTLPTTRSHVHELLAVRESIKFAITLGTHE
jgi:hypothetical protein